MISRLRKEVQVAAGPVAVVTVGPVELARVEVAPVVAVQLGVATAALVEVVPLQSAAADPAPVDVARAQ